MYLHIKIYKVKKKKGIFVKKQPYVSLKKICKNYFCSLTNNTTEQWRPGNLRPGAAAVYDAAAPSLPIPFLFSAPKRNGRKEVENGSVDWALALVRF